MQQQNLKQLLKHLHEELQGVPQLDEELRLILQELNQDIQQVLNKDADADDPVFAALSERSQALSAKFAAQHPKLEPVLRELGDMLEKMGV